ncbi:hypothetical protein F4781DRAFT_415310 [Annulohypoxylon bovei var. microspora]|nr:hypothetical protein F4781DRAFT_415310 [Annulohypoxylon bovei var. microspora]
METYTRRIQSRVHLQPNIAVGIGVSIKLIALTSLLSISWIAYTRSISYINMGSLDSSLFNPIDQSGLVARKGAHVQTCVDSQSHTPGIGILINITALTLLSLYMTYNQLWVYEGREVVLERPILDLYDQIGCMTIPIAYTYCFESISTSKLSTSLCLIQAGNALTTLLSTLVEDPTTDRITICLIINIFSITCFSLLDSEYRVFGEASGAIFMIFWSYETSRRTFTHHAPKSSKRPVKNTIADQNQFSENLRLVSQNLSSVVLALTAILYLRWMWKLNSRQCHHETMSYHKVFSQAIPVLALFKPFASICCEFRFLDILSCTLTV